MNTTSSKKYKYDGVKKVEKWIQQNEFTIHEAAHGGVDQYRQLIQSLGQVLSSCRNEIKLTQTTKLKSVVHIDYRGGTWKKFNLSIHPKSRTFHARGSMNLTPDIEIYE